jgi:hypothetical protein
MARAMRPTCEVIWMADYYLALIRHDSGALAKALDQGGPAPEQITAARGPADMRRERRA